MNETMSDAQTPETSEVQEFREALELGRYIDNIVQGANPQEKEFVGILRNELDKVFLRVSPMVRAAFMAKAASGMEKVLQRESNKLARKALKAGVHAIWNLHDQEVCVNHWYRRAAPARAASLAKMEELTDRLQTVKEMEGVIESKILPDLRAIRQSVAHLGGIAQGIDKLNAPSPVPATN